MIAFTIIIWMEFRNANKQKKAQGYLLPEGGSRGSGEDEPSWPLSGQWRRWAFVAPVVGVYDLNGSCLGHDWREQLYPFVLQIRS
jgi:hypothetical protein